MLFRTFFINCVLQKKLVILVRTWGIYGHPKWYPKIGIIYG